MKFETVMVRLKDEGFTVRNSKGSPVYKATRGNERASIEFYVNPNGEVRNYICVDENKSVTPVWSLSVALMTYVDLTWTNKAYAR